MKGAIKQLISKQLPAILVLSMCGTFSAAANAASDATAKDEARWGLEDTTPQARYRTMAKEAAAAYRENTSQCKTMAASERSACMKEAKANYQKELADAKKASSR